MSVVIESLDLNFIVNRRKRKIVTKERLMGLIENIDVSHASPDKEPAHFSCHRLFYLLGRSAISHIRFEFIHYGQRE